MNINQFYFSNRTINRLLLLSLVVLTCYIPIYSVYQCTLPGSTRFVPGGTEYIEPGIIDKILSLRHFIMQTSYFFMTIFSIYVVLLIMKLFILIKKIIRLIKDIDLAGVFFVIFTISIFLIYTIALAFLYYQLNLHGKKNYFACFFYV